MGIHEKAAIGFDRAGDAYERGRPDYPQAALDFIIQTLPITETSTVLDLGAGTGKFTKLLISSGAQIIAVEPVEGMRRKFQALLPQIEMRNGTAENIPLPDNFADVVVVAQSFHWFDGPTALREIHRVLKPRGKLCLIWNVRDEAQSWVAELTDIMDFYGGETPRYKSMHWKAALNTTSLFSPLQVRYFTYTQTGTIETVVDRVGSVSFISRDHREDLMARRTTRTGPLPICT